MPSGGTFSGQELKCSGRAKALYVQTIHENLTTTSCLDTGNDVGVVLEPETGVAGDVSQTVTPAAKILQYSDQSVCAVRRGVYVMAGSNQCQLADPQHVQAISGNARQPFEDQLYKFCGAHLQNKPPM